LVLIKIMAELICSKDKLFSIEGAFSFFLPSENKQILLLDVFDKSFVIYYINI